MNLSEFVAFFESLAAGRELLETSIEFSRRRGLTHNLMWSRASMLSYLYELGQWDELLRESGEIVRWDREHGGTQIESFALTVTIPVLLHLGRFEEAARAIAIVLPRAREIGDPQAVGPALIQAALVSASLGRLDEAIALAEEFRSVAGRERVDVQSGLLGVARVCVAAGRPDIVEELLRDVGDGRGPVVRSARASTRALLCEARGDTDEAAKLYREAAAGWSEWGSVVEHAYALLGLGRCGDGTAAHEGAAVFARLGATPFPAAARAA
jgi:hypothetical protein